ncbi:MAG TPA: WD40 repeat domain-containing protein [Ktedonobacteraceae bacterium]|nr:WD40 repeat domain-containing protein [Ktedonobacteraceae bacterium]
MGNYDISVHPPERVKKRFAIGRPSRRQVLIGGLVAGAALIGGGALVESRPGQMPQSMASQPLVLDMAWDGLDFAWLPDNAHLAYVSDHGLCIVDVKSGQKVWLNHSYKYPEAVTWSEDGTRIAFTMRGTLWVQDVKRGQNLWTYTDPQRPIDRAVLSPDGTRIAFTSVNPGAGIEIWNIEEKGRIAQYQGQGGRQGFAVISLKWSPDSTRIAMTGQDGSVQVRDASGHLLWVYNGQSASGPRGVISWSPDSSAIAFTAGNQNLLGVWDAHSGKTRFQAAADVGDIIDQNQSNKSMAWSPDGTRIAFWRQMQGGPVIEVWSVQTAQRLFSCSPIQGQANALTWSPDGKYLAAPDYIVGQGELARGDNGDRSVIQFWDARNGKSLFSYGAPKNPTHLTWSPDSHYLAVITPKAYGILANSTCQSLCSYGYKNYALQVFRL